MVSNWIFRCDELNPREYIALMILLDTNVISELMRLGPDPKVVRWITNNNASNLYISTITKTEILFGILVLSSGKKRTLLTNAANNIFQEVFAERILYFDIEAAASCALIRAERKKLGQPISFPDSQIAGIARSQNFALATRNVKDFENCGFDTINPWDTT